MTVEDMALSAAPAIVSDLVYIGVYIQRCKRTREIRDTAEERGRTKDVYIFF